MDANSRQYAPVGELTIFEAASFKESLIQLISNDGLVCMDLGEVTHVDTTAIQLMWAARKLGRILVTGIPQELHTKMTQLGFSEPLSE
jgi:anti-anti-sigma regulatory factor